MSRTRKHFAALVADEACRAREIAVASDLVGGRRALAPPAIAIAMTITRTATLGLT